MSYDNTAALTSFKDATTNALAKYPYADTIKKVNSLYDVLATSGKSEAEKTQITLDINVLHDLVLLYLETESATQKYLTKYPMSDSNCYAGTIKVYSDPTITAAKWPFPSDGRVHFNILSTGGLFSDAKAGVVNAIFTAENCTPITNYLQDNPTLAFMDNFDKIYQAIATELVSPISCAPWENKLLCTCPTNICDISNVIYKSTEKATLNRIEAISLHIQGWDSYNPQNSTISKIVISEPSILAGLLYLDLSYNSIDSLPDLTKLTLLKSIYLQDNSLTSLPSLSGLRDLGSLNFSNNSIKEIPKDAFKGLSHISFLGLKSNEITTLPSTVFSSLYGKALAIDVSCNQITSSSLEPFTNINNVKVIQRLSLCSNSGYSEGACKKLGLIKLGQCYDDLICSSEAGSC